MRTLLFAIVLISLVGCARRLGNYSLRVNASTYRTVKKASGDKKLTEVLLDTLTKAHPELQNIQLVNHTDTFYLPPHQQVKEIPSNLRYSQSDVDELMAAFKERGWTKIDTMLQRVSENDPLARTEARDMIPLLQGLRPNSDTLRLVDTLRGVEFTAWMYKGVLLGEEKSNRFAVAVTQKTETRTINPAPACPPQKQWLGMWQTWIACGLLGLCVFKIIIKA